MTTAEAIQVALGYAWGAEDFSGTKTASPTDLPGTLAFAEAFAAGWDDFNAERRHHMTNVMDAYRRWQESAGASIFAATALVRAA
jgi:hypothetical protein